MKSIAVIARTGAGKSHFIENEILKKFLFDKKFNKPRRNCIIDWNTEYLKYKNIYTGLNDKDDFLEFISTQGSADGTCWNLIYEEGDLFLCKSGSIDKRVLLQISRPFHTRNLNVFVFHSMLDIPKDIIRRLDMFVIFQTLDDCDEVEKYYKNEPEILACYKDVYGKTKGTFFNRDTKTYPDKRSKDFFHYKRIHTR